LLHIIVGHPYALLSGVNRQEISMLRRIPVRSTSKLLPLAWILFAFALLARAQNSTSVADSHRRILVSIPDRKLAVVEDNTVIRIFPVAVGADVSPSPAGNFQIVTRVSNPTYYHPGVVIPAGKDSPIGTRWIGLDKSGYGIHGTNVPASIGHAASHGCIRLRNRDVEELFSLVHVGDMVEIRAEHNDELASIFEDQKQAEAALSTLSSGGTE
jgi:lipoprotein-anchoring transpeptidase ErfK/SrfK